MPDFTKRTADEAFAQISRQGRAQRYRTIRRLLYRKSERPTPLDEQLRLLEMFAADETLNKFERTYALVATAHKASETGAKDKLASFIPRLESGFAWARTLPMCNELRKDGLHLSFSILNVLINASVLLGLEQRYDYADHALTTLKGINPRKTGRYTYNSATNILNTVGVALLIRPATLHGSSNILGLLRNLIYHGLVLNFGGNLHTVLLRSGIPSTLAEIVPPSSFTEFESSFRRYLTIRCALLATTDQEMQDLYWQIADQCIAQHAPAQKAAHLAAVRRHLLPTWQMEPSQGV
ncbi:hypothetical protein P775_18435 [Puniceibacterium antarcticum]|uniref:Uncharacterized protein n=1 Tax=Puniceibacterium antarcticum TaxID=1206336 RepID=A0A2G8RAM7_9RHOB|nr:hypothetical protein [Puniceibacterium antarcticum]PIL18553.1 hypothetical protein P775_18435 [Puniceibacterium antarcticum]